METGIQLPDLNWDDVYDVWAYQCGQDDLKTSQETGIPRRTIAYHRKVHGWQDRYVSDHFGLSEADLNLARIAVRSLAKEGIQRRLRSIILDEVPTTDVHGNLITDEAGNAVMKWRASDKDAVAAMRIVAEYAIDPGRDTGVGMPLPATFTVKADTETMSESDQAIAILEGNAMMTNTRIKRGRRT